MKDDMLITKKVGTITIEKDPMVERCNCCGRRRRSIKTLNFHWFGGGSSICVTLCRRCRRLLTEVLAAC